MNPLDQVLAVQSQLEKAKPQLTSLQKSCEGMESTFLKQMVSQMRKSAGAVHFGQEFGGEMFRDMFDSSVADILAQKGTLGVAKTMFAAVAPRVLNQANVPNQSISRKTSTEGN